MDVIYYCLTLDYLGIGAYPFDTATVKKGPEDRNTSTCNKCFMEKIIWNHYLGNLLYGPTKMGEIFGNVGLFPLRGTLCPKCGNCGKCGTTKHPDTLT